MGQILRTVTVIGATGLVGGHLVERLAADPAFMSIRVLVRRPVSFSSSKVDVRQVDLSDPAAYAPAIAGSDAVFCAVGTTQRKVKGDLEAYRRVDHFIPVQAAKACIETGCPQFLLVSAVGADSGSRNFYLKLKGEVEDEIRELGVPSAAVFRPSLLLGARSEFRLGEKLAQGIMPLISFLLPSRYRAVRAEAVAGAVVEAAKQAKPGFHVYSYREMMELNGGQG